jgi:uncharacterized protein YegL
MPNLVGEVAKRNLHFFWLIDNSGSMYGQKIATLNTAVNEAVEAVKNALAAHSEINILMSAIKFSNDASWHIGPEPVQIEDFKWQDLSADGCTATSQAINLLCEELDVEKMSRRAVPPVCILVSDGFCTDSPEEYQAAIDRLNRLPWGKKAVRLVIAIGQDSEYDEAELLKFTNHKEIGVLKAETPEELVNYIKWASTTASLSASMSKSRTDSTISEDAEGSNVILASAPPEPIAINTANDVF